MNARRTPTATRLNQTAHELTALWLMNMEADKVHQIVSLTQSPGLSTSRCGSRDVFAGVPRGAQLLSLVRCDLQLI